MSETKKSKILIAARSVFLRYGYKRVSMNDIAEAAGISRPGLYLLFKNKEEIFVGVFLQWVDQTIAEVNAVMARAATPEEQLDRAFEVWVVQPFEMTAASGEARELLECNFSFAQDASNFGYSTFATTITPVVAALTERLPFVSQVAPARAAQVLVSAVRGFKSTATTSDELRQLIRDLMLLCFSPNQDVSTLGHAAKRGARFSISDRTPSAASG